MNDEQMRTRGDIKVPAHARTERSFVNEAVRWRVIVDGLRGLMDAVPYVDKGFYASVAELFLYAEERRRNVVAELQIASGQRGFFDDS